MRLFLCILLTLCAIPAFAQRLAPRETTVIFAGNKKAKVSVQRYPNKQIRRYFLNQRVSNKTIASFDHPINDVDFAEVGPLGRRIVSSLLRIPGVTEVTLEPKEVVVTIGELFPWEKLDRQIRETLGKVLLLGTTGGNYPYPPTLLLKTETAPNYQVRVFHANRKVSKSEVALFIGRLDEQADWDQLQEVGEIGTNIVRQIYEIRGIDTVSLSSYSAQISLREGYHWTPELEKKIKKILIDTIKGKRVQRKPPKRAPRDIPTTDI